MDIHHYIFCTAMLTTMFVAGQSKFALLFPIWAIVAIMSALPAMVIRATVMGIKAFVATVFGWHTRRLCPAIERIATVLAGKRLGMAFHRGIKTGAAAIVPNGSGGASIASELLATPLTDKISEWIFPHEFAVAFAKAFARAILTFLFGSSEEDFAANWASLFDARNTGDHSYTSGSINRGFVGARSPERTFVSR